jgi:hypothetical protein
MGTRKSNTELLEYITGKQLMLRLMKYRYEGVRRVSSRSSRKGVWVEATAFIELRFRA